MGEIGPGLSEVAFRAPGHQIRPPEIKIPMMGPGFGESIGLMEGPGGRAMLGRALMDAFSPQASGPEDKVGKFMEQIIAGQSRQTATTEKVREELEKEKIRDVLRYEAQVNRKSPAQYYLEASAPTHPDFPETDMAVIGSTIGIVSGFVSGISMKGGGANIGSGGIVNEALINFAMMNAGEMVA